MPVVSEAVEISIHAPHARSDKPLPIYIFLPRNFNPRSSCEERLQLADVEILVAAISIHAPHARSDCVNFRH